MEKLPIHSDGDPQDQNERTRPSTATFLRRLCIVVLFLVGYYLLIRPSSTCTQHHTKLPESYTLGLEDITNEDSHNPDAGHIPDAQSTPAQTKIPLEAHIMSKCPDAQACLQKLILPAMEKIYDKVDFRLSFIANASESSEEIECMHGPGECIGNMLMLCAANLPFPPPTDESLLPPAYPRTPIIRSLGFANCLINDYAKIPDREFIHQCAMEHGIDFDSLNKCASQQNDDPGDGDDGGPPLSGIALLRESAVRGAKLGVKTSCTVRLDDAFWCIRDNNEWKNCSQNGEGSNPSVLVDQVEKLWKERN
jgi:hypothetical protein